MAVVIISSESESELAEIQDIICSPKVFTPSKRYAGVIMKGYSRNVV